MIMLSSTNDIIQYYINNEFFLKNLYKAQIVSPLHIHKQQSGQRITRYILSFNLSVIFFFGKYAIFVLFSLSSHSPMRKLGYNIS